MKAAKSKLDKAEVEQKLVVTQAVNSVEKERDDLKVRLQSKEHEIQLREVSLKEKYENELKTISLNSFSNSTM